MNFEELMLHIERRPEVYVGERSIFLLSAFLSGYLLNDAIRLGERAKYDFRYDFGEWLRNKFNYELELGWSTIITEISQKENLDAINVFFREYHLFKKEK
ncbi:hypothetical protein QFZ37_002298 [Chryseobacterium ginsenosidimutans]|uniref:hypothetical protein n=1 Tax=Chryseobacterium ginsenosidimutans TaxID=687846 RepID=UPI00278A19E4|nr:hypothetical protein [Chryseobacterium ginsenosidimutans]MDQ0593929.1 hypothetical protein [Chryseobacterium ginsenosidimutans]